MPDATLLPARAREGSAKECRRFLGWLGGFIGFGAAAFLAMLLGLWLAGSLPAAPVTATSCIDEKFKFLAQQDLDQVDMLAVGSSTTWRNLDFRPIVERRVADQPINAAPCYLFMDQVTFLTGFLLDHMPQVKSVITIVSPRDFNYCGEEDRAFFDEDKAAGYIFDGGSPLPIYLTNFRPYAFIRDALTVAEQRSGPSAKRSLFMGPYGAGPVEGSEEWNPPPDFDATCFAALQAFERMLVERGVRPVVVTFLPSPAWRAEHDPQGEVFQAFEERLRGALSSPGTRFISGQSLAVDDSYYYDSIHFQWQGAQRFSTALADRLASERMRFGTARHVRTTGQSR